jgi:peroxiredoxin 2/4
MVKVGKQAPTFTLEGYQNGEFKKYSLEDYKGKWIVLFFYPLDFTFVCPTEVTGFSKHIKEFDDLNTQILGVSVDSVHSHKAWEKEIGKFEYPLLSDIQKDVSKLYNVLIEEEGIALRATFVIDPEGNVQYHLVNSNNIGRNIGEVIRVVTALQSGELCPVDWTPGSKTLGKA